MINGLLEKLRTKEATIAVVGLGYVGLPLAVAFAQKFSVIGFDINARRVDRLVEGIDETGEVEAGALNQSTLTLTAEKTALAKARFICVTVPTPVDKAKRPDLTPVLSASRSIGERLQPGTVIVYESTVYPGVTEERCVPVLEKASGLKCGVDFFVGYSPERINPGDKEHTIEKIVKVVSGQDAATLDLVAGVYGEIITAGIHRATSIKVAEAAKVIENIQRDINIALVNELSLIFNLMNIRTDDVLAASGTKWNFLPFRPGLVGGHCIGVDPYYLTAKAEELGYHPQMILSGRRINDGMGAYVAEQVVKRLIHMGKRVKGARAGVFGLTFKENVPDLRNSRVPDIIDELRDFGLEVRVADPVCDPDEAVREYGVELAPMASLTGLDVAIVAVAHDPFVAFGANGFGKTLADDGGLLVDLKSLFDPATLPASLPYWSL